MNKESFGKVALTIVMACVVGIILSGAAGAATITVNAGGGADYTKIQDAINAASNGDTISVAAGTYNENVVVNKSVSLIGSGADVTIVKALNPNNHVFNITANSVNLSGFTVMGATTFPNAGIYLSRVYANIADNKAMNNYFGIALFPYSGNNSLIDNIANGNDYGIFFRGSSRNILINNTANGNRFGSGFNLESYSNDNTLINNIASSNNYNGIAFYGSSNNTLINNAANSNYYHGIHIESSNDNVLINNTIKWNNYGGVFLWAPYNNNKIYNNVFNNTNNFEFHGTSTNIWNTTRQLGRNIVGGPNLGGNFWAYPNGTGFSQTCTDADRDGICDSAYVLNENNIDYLPLAYKNTFIYFVSAEWLNWHTIRVHYSNNLDAPGPIGMIYVNSDGSFHAGAIGWPSSQVSGYADFDPGNDTNAFYWSADPGYTRWYKLTNSQGMSEMFRLPAFNGITASITSPSQQTFAFGTPINFTSQAAGGTPPYNYSWESSRDGIISTAPSFNISNLSIGTHTITLTVTDANNSKATDTKIITITGGTLDNGLVAEWHFDGDALDSSGNGNHGVINGATFGQGISGQALSLDGVNDYVVISDSASLRPKSLTEMAWVKFNNNPTSIRQIISKNIGTNRYESFGLWWIEGSYNGCSNGAFQGNLDESLSVEDGVCYPTAPVIGQWYFLVHTFNYETKEQKLYLNGLQVAGKTSTVSSIAYDTRPLTIGAEYEFNVMSFFFNGLIDEVRIYNRALSAEEIKQHYTQYTVRSKFNISGYKINNATKIGISDWNITLANSTMQMSMLTLADGSYKFTNLVNGSYNVTEETRSDFTNISPTTVQITINGSDVPNVNFTNQPVPVIVPTFNTSITSPSQQTFAFGTPISFTSQVTGGAPPYNYSWESSRDGIISTAPSFSISNLSIGTHTITLTATDANSSKATDTKLITVTGVDLGIKSSDISFSNSWPMQNEEITINASITNSGSDSASNVSVRFYDGTTLIGEALIPSISHQSRGVAEIRYTPNISGYRLIKVVVDEANNITEGDETNNIAIRPLSVGSGNFYGGIEISASIETPKYTGEYARVNGSAIYNTTFGSGENVAGALVTITIDGKAYTTYTTSFGTFSTNIIAPFSAGQYPVVIRITDNTFVNETNRMLIVNDWQDPLPDLLVTTEGITFPQSYVVNESSTINANILNIGKADASDVTVNFYDDGVLFDTKTISSIPKGGSATTSGIFAPSYSGTHTITVKVDVNNTIRETNENNNQASRNTYVYPDIPDFTPLYIYYSDDTPYDGQNVIVYTDIANIGGKDGSTDISFYLDNNFIGTVSVSVKGRNDHTIAQLPITFVNPGWHQIKVIADEAGNVKEADENNNETTGYIYVHPPQPDLIADDISLNISNPISGDSILVTGAFKNDGEISANNVVADLYVGNTLVNSTTIPTLASGSAETITYSWIPTTDGYFDIKLSIDPQNTTAEFNEYNNIRIETYYIRPQPDLIVNEITFNNSSPKHGDIINITAAIKNIGKTTVSNVKVAFYDDDIKIGETTIPEVSNLENTTIAWNAISGLHTIKVVVDPYSEIHEINEANNEFSRLIDVLAPDIQILSEDIYYSNNNPIVDENVVIYANISNIGTYRAENISINFSIDDILINTTTIPSISNKSSAMVTSNWTAKGIGSHVVKIEALFAGFELNKTNNIATRGLVVGQDTVPPDSVTDLHNISYAQTYINWTWDDPIDADFDHVEVYIDGNFTTNVLKGVQFYNSTGFAPDTEHTIATRTVDTSGNINLTQADRTARTAPPPDTTPPTTVINISGTAGNNNWYVSEAQVTLMATDNVSGVNTTEYSFDNANWNTYSTPFNVTTEGITTIYYRSIDNAGNVETAKNTTISIDKTKSDITGTPTTTPNANNWYNSNVIVHFEASDGISGIDSITPDTTLSTEGSGQSVIGTATDKAGNSNSTTVSGINIDETLPEITINIPANRANYLLNENVNADFSATDAVSGIDTITGTVPNGSLIDTTVGPKNFTVTATDKAGNQASKTVAYNVVYGYCGIQPPIKEDGSSVFKLGSTVPVKFCLTDSSNNYVTNAIAKIYVSQISNNVAGTETEANSTSNATEGNLFRYSTTDNQYIFNLATKPLSAGTWQIRIELDDGTNKYVNIGLKK